MNSIKKLVEEKSKNDLYFKRELQREFKRLDRQVAMLKRRERRKIK